jgi:hypothetical protein
MFPFHYIDARTAERRAALKARTAGERRIRAARNRKRAVIVTAIAAIVVIGASFHARYALAAHMPNDMPVNSRWILTGHVRDTNEKLGLWVGCWKSAFVDHCRIADERGTVEYDGDMLPLAIHPAVVEDKDLQFAKIDPERLWIRGVHDDLPVPVLPLADGTQLVPVSDREGLQKRLADGEWLESMEPARPRPAR